MDREQWLAERRKGIGASDAAAVCGLSPWRTPLEVYLDKKGLLPAEETPAMRWGLKLEETIAAAYEEETGRYLVQCPMYRLTDPAWCCATIDRITHPENNRIVELKTSRSAEGWGLPGTDEVPTPYYLQVQHQMYVAGLGVADIALLIAGSDFRIYTVLRYDEVIRRLLAIEEAFWRRVQANDPPPVDWEDPRTPGLVSLLNPPKEEVVIGLGDGEMAAVDMYNAALAEIRASETAAAAYKGLLIERMGNASIGRLPDGREIVRKMVTRRAHEVKESTYQTFSIRKGKG